MQIITNLSSEDFVKNSLRKPLLKRITSLKLVITITIQGKGF